MHLYTKNINNILTVFTNDYFEISGVTDGPLSLYIAMHWLNLSYQESLLM